MTSRWLFATALGCGLGACASTGNVSLPKLDECRGYLSQGQYEDAERICNASFAEIGNDAGAQKASAHQLLDLASGAIRFGDYRIAERAAGLAAPYDGNALAVLAVAKNKLGDYDAAIARGSEYLERYGTDTPKALDAISAVGTALATLERFGEARRMVKTANRLAAARVDSFATVSANSLESYVLWLAGDRKASGELATRALALAIQSGLDTSMLLNTVAKLKFEQAKYDEARALLEKSLGVAHVKPWPGHPDYARAMNDIGLLDYATGRTDDAETRFLLALKVRKKRLGPAHTSVAQTLNNLAAHYHRLGDLDQAAALYEKALDINLAVLGTGNRRTQLIFANLEMLAKDRRKSAVPRREPNLDGP
ncbi:MAG: tetratricopeptide repeat protein [Pseudomonadota bacterium]|nr:tetratricopeptide repeat protein [Pseudomonadota bacterium]